MLDDSTPDTPAAPTTTTDPPATTVTRTRRRAASRPAGPPVSTGADTAAAELPGSEPSATAPPVDGSAAAKKPARKTTKRAASKKTVVEAGDPRSSEVPAEVPAEQTEPAKKTTRRRTTKRAAAPDSTGAPADTTSGSSAAALVFQPPDPSTLTPEPVAVSEPEPDPEATVDTAAAGAASASTGEDAADLPRRRRRRGGRRRRKPASGAVETEAVVPDGQIVEPDTADETPAGDDAEVTSEGGTRRRRRRRRRGEEGDTSPDDPANTVVRVREPRRTNDEITSVEGSTRLEAKKQRRREGRDAGRRRVPIVSEAEFLARRESVTREMVVRQRADVMQIAVVEDGVLAEHYVARESQTSIIGNVFLGRVQNVLPSMEAAFIDIGKGRNAVLYAGEVDWKALGRDGKPRKIEDALKSGQPVLVQVTKDPVGHKGARLTSAISLPGRFLVYVPDGHTSGISRKLPDIERNRLKSLTKGLLPEDAGVIIRTAAEGATEEQLTRDVTGLTARWDDISAKAKGGRAPQLLYGEPDLMIKVVRDLFNEDFRRLVVDGDDAWDMIEAYVTHVAPDLRERLERWSPDEKNAADVFSAYRIDEQIAKALDRKVWLPSGGSLVIDRTEAMTVVDVNTGKFTGSGGNLEETVTRNNLEAADEMVRQLRLRDIGGIIVIDFIDMVLESNRDLVLRRLIECLGRDRTRHQVAEVTSLGLVQMTRKRIGTGLLEAFSSPCEHCQGRGLLMHTEPVEQRATSDDGPRYTKRRGKSDAATSDGTASDGTASDAAIVEPSPQLAGK